MSQIVKLIEDTDQWRITINGVDYTPRGQRIPTKWVAKRSAKKVLKNLGYREWKQTFEDDVVTFEVENA
jgi:hypothetical protein